jgi:hypothetical protein
MFASLGVAVGAVVLLVFLIVRLVVARRRNVIKSLSTSSQSSTSSVEKQQQQQQFAAASKPPQNSETVALLSSVNTSPPCITTSAGSGSSETSLSRQRRRPDKVHFAQPPSDVELDAIRPSHGTSVTDDTVMTPASTATSLNDVFLPSSASTPSAQPQGVISRQWQMSADVIDDVDDVTVGVLLRNDTSRGSFYNNPYRHDTIDGRIRTSRVK